jgi:hypothetical protein
MVDWWTSWPMIVLDVLVSADKLGTPRLGAPLGVRIFAGLYCMSLMKFTFQLYFAGHMKVNIDFLNSFF